MNFKHKWIYYPWVKGSSETELVLDDSSIDYSIGVCYCEDYKEPYMILKTINSRVQAKPWERMRVLPEPLFTYDVKVKEKEGKERVGKISKMTWHFKDKNFRYWIEVEGKERKRMYRPEELEKMNEGPGTRN